MNDDLWSQEAMEFRDRVAQHRNIEDGMLCVCGEVVVRPHVSCLSLSEEGLEILQRRKS